MQAEDVINLIADFKEQGFPCWIAGGWGVDALVGEQTRTHQDLDLATDKRQFDQITAHLAAEGWRVTIDWFPVRVEMTSPVGTRVDLHPLVFAPDGSARQQGLEDTWYDYPADQFATGIIDGIAVPCIGKELQISFHQGYTPREIDLLDLARLARL